MKIISYIKEWTRHEWPTVEARQPRFFPLATAYACPACRTVQDRAPHGVCERCGEANIRSIDLLLDWSSSSLHKKIEQAREAKRQAAAEEALKKNQEQVARSLARHPDLSSEAARSNAIHRAAAKLDQSPQSLTEFRVK